MSTLLYLVSPRNLALRGKLEATWISVLFLIGVVMFEAWYMTPSLFRTWYFSSDEYVVVAEVIRFLHLDFRQHFFEVIVAQAR